MSSSTQIILLVILILGSAFFSGTEAALMSVNRIRIKNAAGNGKEWKTARGGCAFTTKGTTKSDAFAECLYDEAKKNFQFFGHFRDSSVRMGYLYPDYTGFSRDCKSTY